MAITKEKKVEIVDKLKEIVKNSKSLVFVNFHGLGVGDITSVRSELLKKDVGYFVAKKTLIRRALTQDSPDGEMPSLAGELALIYGNDELAPSREVHVFCKKFKDGLAILGGVFDGKYQNAQDMTQIATIPGVDVLRGMFVNVINSPIQGLVVALNQIAEKKN